MKDEPTPQDTKGSVPVPDPTQLTTAALRREIENLKELMEAKIGFTNILKEEKFHELHLRLAAVEAHRKEAKADSERALSAALSAQKELFEQQSKCNEEAATKAETSFMKQIEAIRQEATLGRDALSERVNAIKERMDRGGGREENRIETRQESRQTQGWLIPLIIIGSISAVGLLLQIIRLFPVTP